MYINREKALAKGKRKDKTFVRVFCGMTAERKSRQLI